MSDFYGSEIVALSSVHISLVFGENLFEVSVILLALKKKSIIGRGEKVIVMAVRRKTREFTKGKLKI